MTTTTATAPARQRKPRQKPQRFIGWALQPGPDGTNGVVRIRVGKAQADYLLTPIPADFGRGFRLEKVGLEADGEGPYHVNLDGASGTCDCKGFGRWNHCKHADGLAALIAAGKL
jgi:hypothetical protein